MRAVLALAWVSVIAPSAWADTRSVAVYPPRAKVGVFDHRPHRQVPCATCHPAAASLAAADDLLPPAMTCQRCHPAGVTWTRSAAPPPALKFNHKQHLDRGFPCERCHGDVTQSGLSTYLPSMASCLSCHDGRRAADHATGRCASCHPTLEDGRLRTTWPTGRLVPSGSLRGFDAHGPGFREAHKEAGRDAGFCATCHRRTECSDCHGEGVVRPQGIHPADYVSLHAQDARHNTPDCSSCHRSQTFCVGCHQRLGVASEHEGGQPGRKPWNPFGTGTAVKSFHPPGWAREASGVVAVGRGPSHHAWAAQRNLRTCASCHREDTCLECHSTDPTRSGSWTPHGPGFGDSARCRALAARNRRACVKCHRPDAPEIECR